MILPPPTIQIEVSHQRSGLYVGHARSRLIEAQAWNLWDLEAALLDEVHRYCGRVGNPPSTVEIWYGEDLLARLDIAVLALVSAASSRDADRA